MSAEQALPRIFLTKKSAVNSLSQWLRGRHQTQYEEYGSIDSFISEVTSRNEVTPIPSRKKDEMAIIKMRLSVASCGVIECLMK